ncbi:hypothetical protein H310_10681 [Aphanomyces invadans]|uniref:Peroxin-7 n=2 Tax=Aphanomyces invadans TaxID=157072 RepID=A0A024TQX5_9STRA|nr:hypothetical protein H310_10681 [Aphanomyces invadans]ETV96031.1 hypothetical protein H310_10681 [Aphanomyces invadans]|eukprot:XP_008875342.1 hypothetical protein H310_10681 [Aphanomyces invadans]
MFVQPRRVGTDFSGYAVEFSPFHEHWVAVGTAQYFGIIGNGQAVAMELMPDGSLATMRSFDTQDGVYDIAWSEMHPNQLVAGCANGHLKLFDVTTRDSFPIQSFAEHTQEVSGVNWNLVDRQTFVSASWDHSIKVWHPHHPTSLQTLHGHTGPVYNAVWSTREASHVASCSGDGSVRVWDLKVPGQAVCHIAAHAHDVLALDWNKYSPYEVVSGSADASLKVWDIRNVSAEVRHLRGHQYAVRRIKCSPHDRHVVGSASLDMSVRLWNTQAVHPHMQCATHHTEFVLGLDFSLFAPGLVASCSWDRSIVMWNHRGGPPPRAV